MVSPRETSHCSILVGAGQHRPWRVRKRCRGGDEGTRTPDPLLAKEVLSQLSYIPTTRIVSAAAVPVKARLSERAPCGHRAAGRVLELPTDECRRPPRSRASRDRRA